MATPKKLSAFTVRRLRVISSFILGSPGRYDQHSNRPVCKEQCGTAGCILGWAEGLFKPEKLRRLSASERVSLTHFSDGPRDLFRQAASNLDLNFWQANRLWSMCFWPTEFEQGYARAKGSLNTKSRNRLKARVAVDRINHFIATNGAE